MSNNKNKKHMIDVSKYTDGTNKKIDFLAEIFVGILIVFSILWPILLVSFVSIAINGFSWEILFKYLAVIICYYLAFTFLFGSVRESSDKPFRSEKEESKH